MADDSTFQKMVMSHLRPTMVAFVAPWCGHCQKLVPEYEKLAAKFSDGMIDIIAVDADANRQLASAFGIKGFPTIKFFGTEATKNKNGGQTRMPVDYQGAREGAAMAQWLLEQLPSTRVRSLGSKPVELESFLSDKSKPHAVLFSDKAAAPALWKALSSEFRDFADFALFRGTSANHGVSSTPAVLLAANGEVHTLSDGKPGYASVRRFLAHHLSSGAEKGEHSGASEAEGAESDAPSGAEALVQVASEAEWQARCLSTPGVCVAAFLFDPREEGIDEEEAKERGTVLEAMAAVARAVGGKKNSVVWLNAAEHMDMQRRLSGADMPPAVVALRPSKAKAAAHRGAMQEEVITAFVRKFDRGQGRTFTLQADDMKYN